MALDRRTLLGGAVAGGLAAGPALAAEEQTPGGGAAGRDLRAFGARSDGKADDAAAIRAASAAGSVVFPAGVTRVATSTTIAAPTTLADGAVIRVDGCVLTVHGGFDAPLTKVFDCVGGGTVSFVGGVETVGYPEWWGAVKNDPAINCAAAIQACLNAVPITQLGAGAYYFGRRLDVVNDGRTLRGVAATQRPTVTGGASRLSPDCTQLVLTSPSSDGMLVGYDQAAQPPGVLREFCTLADFTLIRATAAVPLGVARAGAIANPAAGVLPCPVGILFKWCVNCHFDRVLVAEHSIGFYVYGCIECYWDNCSALRYTPGARRGNDNFSGFYLDYSAPLAANGGNASVYFNKCRAFSNVGQGGSYSWCCGFQSVHGFVDAYFTQCESGLTKRGFDLAGETSTGLDMRTEDLILTGCVIDSAADLGIYIHKGGSFTNLQVTNNYVVTTGGTAIYVEDLHGLLNIANNQNIGSGTGLSAYRVDGLHASGNLFNGADQPITLNAVTNFTLRDAISRPNTPASLDAVKLVDCERGKVDCAIKGVAGAFPRGVNLSGSGNRFVEVSCTMINPAAVKGGAANKLVANGTQITVAGPFAGNCLAQGIMT